MGAIKQDLFGFAEAIYPDDDEAQDELVEQLISGEKFVKPGQIRETIKDYEACFNSLAEDEDIGVCAQPFKGQ